MFKYLCIFWILGICTIGLTVDILQFFHHQWWWLTFILSTIVLIIDWCLKSKKINSYLVIFIQIIALLSTFGLGAQFANQQITQRLSAEVKTRQTVEGIVYISQLSDGKIDQWRQQAQLLIPQENRSLKILLYPKNIYDAEGDVIGLSTDQFMLGKYYQVTVDIRPPHGYANNSGFDQEKWLLQQGIQGTATVLYSQEISAKQIQSMGWYEFVVVQNKLLNRWQLWIEELRSDYRKELLKDNTQNIDQNRALLLGLLTGDRSGIDKDMVQLYQYMGISHLLAISGPHVLILAAMFTWLMMQILHMLMRSGRCRDLYNMIPKQRLYLPLFISLVTFYVAFTGFEIPALRTWLIVIICSICLWMRWSISSFTMLLVAAVMILLLDCFAILSAAFWLSFVASALLLTIYQQIQKESYVEYSLIDSIKHFFVILWQSQWRIFIALLPIVIWQFKAVSLISPIINLIAIPFLSLIIVPLDIVASVTWQIFPTLGQIIWGFASVLLNLFNQLLWVLKPLAEWLYLSSYLTSVGLISFSFFVLILALPKGLIPRYWAIAFLIPIIFQSLHKPLLQLELLDVGQGQAIFVQTQKHQILIDTGAGSWQAEQFSMGDRVVIPFLQSLGIRHLDEILLTHLDLDHSGGAAAVINHVDVKNLRANTFDHKLTNYPNVPFTQCYRGQRWQWDQVDFEILSPDLNADRHNQNESSCVVLIKTKMFNDELKILLMGDAGWQTEFELLRHYPDLEVDILVLGHHGSRYSSAYDFLAQLNPKLALISAGKDNRYGHPTPETIARLEDLNIAYVNTARLGKVAVTLPNNQSIWQWDYARSHRRWLQP